MNTQIYLSHEVQQHFGLEKADLQSDTNTVLSFDWRSLWRCDHLISTDNADEHVFIFTNAITQYSVLIIDRDREIHHLLEQFCFQLNRRFELNIRADKWLAQLNLFNDSAYPLGKQMEYIGQTGIEKLISNDGELDQTEFQLNQMGNGSISPQQQVQNRLVSTMTTKLKKAGSSIG